MGSVTGFEILFLVKEPLQITSNAEVYKQKYM